MSTSGAVMDLHRVLISDILELRSDILAKTERLIDLLGGGVPTSPAFLQEQTFSSATAQSMAPDIQTIPQNTPDANAGSKSASVMSLGIRWTAGDHASADHEANKSSPPIYRKLKTPEPSLKLSAGKILHTPLHSSARSLGKLGPATDSPSSLEAAAMFEEKPRLDRAPSLGTRLKKRGSVGSNRRFSEHTAKADSRPIQSEKTTNSIVEINLIDESMRKSTVLAAEHSEVVPGISQVVLEEDEEAETIFGTYDFNGKSREPPPNVPPLPTRREERKAAFNTRISTTTRSDIGKASLGKNLLKVSIASIASPIMSKFDDFEEREKKDVRLSVTESQRPQSIYEIKMQELEYSQYSIIQRVQFFYLIPAFDTKGRRIALSYFDSTDLSAFDFFKTGLHPNSYFNTLWDFLMSILYFASLWIIPVIICYDLKDNTISKLRLLLTATFAADSIITSITPQANPENPSTNFREYESTRPAQRDWFIYWVKTHFIVDIISVLPFDQLVRSETNTRYLLFLLRLVRFYRLPRLISRCAFYTRAKTQVEEILGTGVSKTLPIAIGIFYFIHFNACSSYYTGMLTGFRGWEQLQPGFTNYNVFERYTWTYFLAVGNLFPASSQPQTAAEQVVSIIYIVFGAVLYAGFVGYISSAAISINPSGRLYNQKMEELIDYVKWKKLGDETKEKLISYYETKYRGKYFEEDTLLADMNDSLREEISCHNTRKLIEKVPFLRRETGDGRDEIFFSKMATILHARYYIAGDFITKQGDSGNDMFFILSGKVNVFVNGVKVVSLYDGAYIGEVSLITQVLRTATVQAAAPSILYRLTRHDFHLVISEFPDMKKKIDALREEGQRILKSK